MSRGNEIRERCMRGELNPEQLHQLTMEDYFIRSFEGLQADAAATNNKSGFNSADALCDELSKFLRTQVPNAVYDQFAPLLDAFHGARAGLKLALVVGEIGEALEAVRKNLGPDDHIPEFTAEEAEAADAVIRLMNYCADRNLRLAEAIVAKNRFNRNRPDHSKDARAAKHGKRF